MKHFSGTISSFLKNMIDFVDQMMKAYGKNLKENVLEKSFHCENPKKSL